MLYFGRKKCNLCYSQSTMVIKYMKLMAFLVEKYIISGKRYPASGNLLGIPFTRMGITKF